MNPEPWFLLLVLGADVDPVVLRSSPLGCAAFIADVAGGYRPTVWQGGQNRAVMHSVCGPASALQEIWKGTTRLYAPCRTGSPGVCAPVEIAPRREPPRRAASTHPKPEHHKGPFDAAPDVAR